MKRQSRHWLDPISLLLLVLVSDLIFLRTVLGDLGIARLKLSLNYYTSFGEVLDTTLCDGPGTWTCDIRFSITISSQSPGDIYHYKQQDYYGGTRQVTFLRSISSNDKGDPNPISVALPKWAFQRGSVNLKIEVIEVDPGVKVEAMDNFEVNLNLMDVPLIQENIVLRNPNRRPPSSSSMSIGYSVLCDDPHVYGKLCDKYCKPQDDDSNGHYNCSSVGEKICHSSWIEPDKDCKVPSLCSVGICQNGGTCMELPTSKDYWCTCTADFTGKNCQVARNPCRINACLNGGTCATLVSGRTQCTCPMAFEGDRCQTELDRCRTYSPCGAGSTCHALPNGYTCACALGFAGFNCTIEIDQCSQGKNMCARGSTCVNQPPGSFTCHCQPGLRGRLCEMDIDECQASPPPCLPIYRCVNTVGSYMCELIDKDDCAGVVCGGGGVCIDLPYKYYCQCPAGFSGLNCNHSFAQDLLSKLQEVPDSGLPHVASWSVIVAAVSAATAAQLAAATY